MDAVACPDGLNFSQRRVNSELDVSWPLAKRCRMEYGSSCAVYPIQSSAPSAAAWHQDAAVGLGREAQCLSPATTAPSASRTAPCSEKWLVFAFNDE
mmetsp:Transcript_43962/g.80332  ORF Transcript_43962/g.80332 Transcript_43962/m.80332 type:complete len:97 (+) Transcript_43962:76-366(+)